MNESAIQPGRLRGARILAWIACAIVLILVGIALARQFGNVEWSKVTFRPWPVVLATLCLLAVAGVQLAARWGLLLAYRQHLSWRQLLAVSWVPAIGKYVLSGVASVGGAVVMLRGYGVPGVIGLSVTVLLDALAVLAGFIVSAPLLLQPGVREKLPFAWLVCVILIIAGVTLLHPHVFVTILNVILKRARREPIEEAPAASRYLLPVIMSFSQWLFAGLSLWLMTRAVTEIGVERLPLFIASSALAITVGYLTPFAPGGIGVREGLYLLTLGPTLGPHVAIVAVASRLVQTTIELGLAAAGLTIMRSASAAQK